jgi:hypothetical protein
MVAKGFFKRSGRGLQQTGRVECWLEKLITAIYWSGAAVKLLARKRANTQLTKRIFVNY